MERELIKLVWCQDAEGQDLMAIAPPFERFYAEDHAVIGGEVMQVVDSCNVFTDNELFQFLKPFIETTTGDMRRIEAKMVFQRMEYKEDEKDEQCD